MAAAAFAKDSGKAEEGEASTEVEDAIIMAEAFLNLHLARTEAEQAANNIVTI